MADIEKVKEIGDAVHKAIRRAVEDCRPAERLEILNGLAAAVSMVVAYDSMQIFLDTLAVCADAKEHVRAIDAGEVPAPN